MGKLEEVAKKLQYEKEDFEKKAREILNKVDLQSIYTETMEDGSIFDDIVEKLSPWRIYEGMCFEYNLEGFSIKLSRTNLTISKDYVHSIFDTEKVRPFYEKFYDKLKRKAENSSISP